MPAANPRQGSTVPFVYPKLCPLLWNRSAVNARTICPPIEQTAPQPPTPSPLPFRISSPRDFRPLQPPSLFLKKSSQRLDICEDNTPTWGACDQTAQSSCFAKKVAQPLSSDGLSGNRSAPTVLNSPHVIAIHLIQECREMYFQQCRKLHNCRICGYLNSQYYQSFYDDY